MELSGRIVSWEGIGAGGEPIRVIDDGQFPPPVARCTATQAACRCRKPPGHDAHGCPCGALWTGPPGADFTRWPPMAPVPGLRFDQEW